MKRSFLNISPYLLLLVPIFLALALILANADANATVEEGTINASFIQIPSVNIIQVVSNIF
ncbi:hypothetical protein [Albibacterium profundi]|uniref:Uncharacterized protein n=1 Tax=Albibacterium profundi TaxID=3134906 RepID=A0ABV5CDZ9_9SPHI